jgi:Mn-dependent DtxR family transcriptional regulator
MDESGYITLTPAGDAIAQRIYERHVIIAQMLMSLGVEEQVAYADACKIEHDLSEESFARLRAHFSAHQKAAPSHPETT